MIGFALRHIMLLSKHNDTKYDGTYQYLEPKKVKCYKDEKIQKVITSTGEEVTSKANYFSKVRPDELDLIDNNTILAIEVFDMLGCKYYRSYT